MLIILACCGHLNVWFALLKSMGALIESFMCKFKCFANQDKGAWHFAVSSTENAKLLLNECWHWLNGLYTKLYFSKGNNMCHCCRKEGLTMQTSRTDTEQLWEQINAKRGFLGVKKQTTFHPCLWEEQKDIYQSMDYLMNVHCCSLKSH